MPNLFLYFVCPQTLAKVQNVLMERFVLLMATGPDAYALHGASIKVSNVYAELMV